jgi:hypothetical protein
MNDTAATAWSVADNDAFSFGAGGVDTAFTVITLINPVDATSLYAVAKTNTTTNCEWKLLFGAADKLQFNCVKLADNTIYVGRLYNTALTTDQTAWHVYAGTASGGSPQAEAGIKIYRDGVQIDDTASSAGAYAGMDNGTSVVANSVNNASAWSKSKYGVVLIIKKELTALEQKRIADRLLAYAGKFL